MRFFEATPVNLIELRNRQTAAGKMLTVSNYGDTHATRVVQVCEADTILAAAKREDVVEHVAAFCLQVTGGYPGTFHAACRTSVNLADQSA